MHHWQWTIFESRKTFVEGKRITLVETNRVIPYESKLKKNFSKNFRNIVKNLGIDGLTNISSDNDTVTIRNAKIEISKLS